MSLLFDLSPLSPEPFVVAYTIIRCYLAEPLLNILELSYYVCRYGPGGPTNNGEEVI